MFSPIDRWSGFSIPEGCLENSPALQCWESERKSLQSPGGTAEMPDNFSRPSETRLIMDALFPALKCRAISMPPPGGAPNTCISIRHGPGSFPPRTTMRLRKTITLARRANAASRMRFGHPASSVAAGHGEYQTDRLTPPQSTRVGHGSSGFFTPLVRPNSRAASFNVRH